MNFSHLRPISPADKTILSRKCKPKILKGSLFKKCLFILEREINIDVRNIDLLLPTWALTGN